MKKFLSIILLSCFAVVTNASEIVTLPDDVVGFSYLDNGVITHVEDLPPPNLPPNCNMPNGPACELPFAKLAVTIKYTLPGCMDTLGPVGYNVANVSGQTLTLAVSAVAIHRKESQHVACYAAHTESVTFVLRNYGGMDVKLDQVARNKFMPLTTTSPETLSNSEDIEVVQVKPFVCPPGRMCPKMVQTEVLLKVGKGSCVNTSLPIAVRTSYEHNGVSMHVAAPVVVSKLARVVRCSGNTSEYHKVVVAGTVAADEIRVLPLN